MKKSMEVPQKQTTKNPRNRTTTGSSNPATEAYSKRKLNQYFNGIHAPLYLLQD
jgi:hypothetical protein